MQLLFHANTGGLANRLRALAGYKALADLYKTPLRVFWESTPACDANFSELFQSADLILYDRATYFAEKKKAHVFRALAWYSDIWAANAQQLTDKKSFIEASLTFLRSLRPVMSIKDGVESFAADRSLQTCIGVHIRLTDLARSTQAFSSAPGFVPELMSEEEGFWQYIETAINAGEGIFVCTDSKATHERLQAAFGPSLYSLLKSWRSETTPLNWITSPRLIARYFLRERIVRTSSIQCALTELLLLSKCKVICGTYYSSFGRLAAALGQCEYYEMCGRTATPASLMNETGQA